MSAEPAGASSPELCLFQGDTPEEVVAAAQGWIDLLAGRPDLTLSEAAAELAAELRPGTLRLAVVAADVEDLVGRLEGALAAILGGAGRLRDPRGTFWSARPLAREGRLALVFPGDGSPYLNMLTELRHRFAAVQRWFDVADAVAHESGRQHYSEIVYPGELRTPRERRRAEHLLRRLENSAAAVLCGNQALLELLGELGIRPEALIGHSLGDWSALSAAGVTRVEAFLRDMDPCLALPTHVTRSNARMAIVMATREEVLAAIAQVGGDVYVAMHNGPRRVVLAGAKAPVRAVCEKLSAGGAAVYRLPFVRAAHTPLTSAIAEPLAEVFESWEAVPPRLEVWSCTTAAPYPGDPDEIRRIAVDNMVKPVEFQRTIENAWEAGIRIFIECGAAGQLADCISDILGSRPHLAVPVDTRHRPGVRQLLTALAAAAAEGVALDPAPLHAGRLRGLPRPEPGAAPAPAVPETVLRRYLADTSAALESHQETLRALLEANDRFTEEFLASQAQVLQSLARPRLAEAPGFPSLAHLPFIDQISSLDPEQAVTVRHRLQAERLPYLLDHCIGGFAPPNPDGAGPLRLIPLTVCIEILAEAASLLFPGQEFTGGRDIVARRPATADGEPWIEVTAEKIGPDEARARIVLLGSGGPTVCTEGVMRFGTREAPPAAAPFALRAGRPARITAAQLYSDHVMFHGPCYQGVSALEAIGEDGIQARLRSLPRGPLLGQADEPALLCDAALLDAMGQVFGYWPLEQLPSDVVVFPTHLDRIEFFAPPIPPGEELECRVRVAQVSAKRLVGDIELLHEGRVHTRVTHWKFWRFNWSWPIILFGRYPGERLATDPLSAQFALPDDGGVTGAVIVQPRSLELTDFLARGVLSRAEYRRYVSLSEGQRRREQYYLGRLVAKDAVRRWLAGSGIEHVGPDMIDVQNDAQGRPVVSGRGLQGLAAPHVSLAHKPGIAVAAASDRAVGIDVEVVAPRDESFVAAAFDEGERALLPAPRDGWVTRFWCAKEAAAKALGTGLATPRAARVVGVEEAGGNVRVELDGRRLEARTAVADTWAVALVTLPE
ncbi:MAG: polyketide synthase dehydratase domain-containing protein [Armatimonadetes bacterium]|nr:polyketide synthase dehydratase domain-containing protein [Armatimonadota bacterium]